MKRDVRDSNCLQGDLARRTHFYQRRQKRGIIERGVLEGSVRTINVINGNKEA